MREELDINWWYSSHWLTGIHNALELLEDLNNRYVVEMRAGALGHTYFHAKQHILKALAEFV